MSFTKITVKEIPNHPDIVIDGVQCSDQVLWIDFLAKQGVNFGENTRNYIIKAKNGFCSMFDKIQFICDCYIRRSRILVHVKLQTNNHGFRAFNKKTGTATRENGPEFLFTNSLLSCSSFPGSPFMEELTMQSQGSGYENLMSPMRNHHSSFGPMSPRSPPNLTMSCFPKYGPTPISSFNPTMHPATQHNFSVNPFGPRSSKQNLFTQDERFFSSEASISEFQINGDYSRPPPTPGANLFPNSSNYSENYEIRIPKLKRFTPPPTPGRSLSRKSEIDIIPLYSEKQNLVPNPTLPALENPFISETDIIPIYHDSPLPILASNSVGELEGLPPTPGANLSPFNSPPTPGGYLSPFNPPPTPGANISPFNPQPNPSANLSPFNPQPNPRANLSPFNPPPTPGAYLSTFNDSFSLDSDYSFLDQLPIPCGFSVPIPAEKNLRCFSISSDFNFDI